MNRSISLFLVLTSLLLLSTQGCHSGDQGPETPADPDPGPIVDSEEPDDRERFDEYPRCRPILPGHNDRFEPRVNWVFVGYQFGDDLEGMRRLMADAVTLDPESHWSLMNVEPFRSNRERINLWYVHRRGSYRDLESLIRLRDPCVEPGSLLYECPRFENEHVVIFQNTYDLLRMAETVLHSCMFGDCTNTAGAAYIGRGYIWIFSAYPFAGLAHGEEATRHYLAHEWGHIFGHLRDHYISPSYGDRIAYTSYTPDQACSDWCDGPYRTYDALRAYSCEQYGHRDRCDDAKMKGRPCLWHEGECVNVVADCAASESEAACLDVPFCGYIRGLHPGAWHGSPCVPFNTGLSINEVVKDDRYDIYVRDAYPAINVGLDCDDGTGCYTCGFRQIGGFRADPFTLMREDFSASYGVYQNRFVEDVIDRIVAGTYESGFWEYLAGSGVGDEAVVSPGLVEGMGRVVGAEGVPGG